MGGGDDPQRCPTDAGITRADWPIGASHRAPDSELRWLKGSGASPALESYPAQSWRVRSARWSALPAKRAWPCTWNGYFGQLLLLDGRNSTHPSCEPAHSPGHDGGCGAASARGSPVTDLLRQEESRGQDAKLSDPWPVIWFECCGKCSPRTATTRSAHEKKRLTILPGCSSSSGHSSGFGARKPVVGPTESTT